MTWSPAQYVFAFQPYTSFVVADKALLDGLYKYTSPLAPLPSVAIPVTYASPSASKVIPVPTFYPLLAVIRPTESIFVTSS